MYRTAMDFSYFCLQWSHWSGSIVVHLFTASITESTDNYGLFQTANAMNLVQDMAFVHCVLNIWEKQLLLFLSSIRARIKSADSGQLEVCHTLSHIARQWIIQDLAQLELSFVEYKLTEFLAHLSLCSGWYLWSLSIHGPSSVRCLSIRRPSGVCSHFQE